MYPENNGDINYTGSTREISVTIHCDFLTTAALWSIKTLTNNSFFIRFLERQARLCRLSLFCNIISLNSFNMLVMIIGLTVYRYNTTEYVSTRHACVRFNHDP